jgi:hypothetical protein
MGTCSFKDMQEVCKRLGLTCCPKKKGELWKGIDANGNLLIIVLHIHAEGRDIPSGTFHQMVIALAFKDEQDFKNFLDDKKRLR